MGYKVLSDSTLMSLNKKKLIELLRVAEHNFFVTDEALDISAEAGKKFAESVKYGQWNKISNLMGEYFKCSQCGYKADIPTCMGEPIYEYCPHCGAKMDLTHGLTHKCVKGV